MIVRLDGCLNNMRELISKITPLGTRSVLYGVHAFWFHPVVVGLAWRRVYGTRPTFYEWVCIFCHDTFGYWGCPNMDGPEGKRHPELGAAIARRIVNWLGGNGDAAYKLTLYHSSHYARMKGAQPSALYAPDKYSICVEPRWFYLLRARLSGEVFEYIENSPLSKLPPELKTPGAWWNWYHRKVKEKICV